MRTAKSIIKDIDEIIINIIKDINENVNYNDELKIYSFTATLKIRKEQEEPLFLIKN